MRLGRKRTSITTITLRAALKTTPTRYGRNLRTLRGGCETMGYRDVLIGTMKPLIWHRNEWFVWKEVMETEKAASKVISHRKKEMRIARESKKSAEELRRIDGECSSLLFHIQDERDCIEDRLLRLQAKRYAISFPDSGEKNSWKQNDFSDHVLTEMARRKIDREIRAEARQCAILWFQAAMAITGVLGALTGVVAVISTAC